MTILTIERNLEVPVRDGTVLLGDLYRASDAAGPTLLMRTPYGKESSMGLMVVLDPLKAAAAGYNVFIQDVRGRFASEGGFTPFVNEAQDGFDTIAWIAGQPWSNGRVGMYGSSYMAATQLQAATLAPPALKAIVPIGGSSDYYEGRSYRGGACEIGSLLSIALFALGPGTLRRERTGGDLRSGLKELKAMLSDLPAQSAKSIADLKRTVLADCAPFLFDWLENDVPGPYWDAVSVASNHHKIGVPMLHITSWFDAFSSGAIANCRGMRANGASDLARQNQYLWIGPWGHYMPRTVVNGAGRLGEFDFGLDALTDIDSVQLGWFDHWLKDKEPDRRFQTSSRVFVLGRNAWLNLPEWPAVTTETALFLADGCALSVMSPQACESSDEYVSDPSNPVPTHGGSHVMLESAFPQGPLQQALIEERDDVLVYTSKPFEQAFTIIGDVLFDVWLSSTAPSTDVVAMMSVVLHDGRSVNLVDGVLRLTLIPGEAQCFTISLGPTARSFIQGERIRLRIAGSNFPRYDLNPQTGLRSCDAKERVAAVQTVLHDSMHPSALRLPVFEGSV